MAPPNPDSQGGLATAAPGLTTEGVTRPAGPSCPNPGTCPLHKVKRAPLGRTQREGVPRPGSMETSWASLRICVTRGEKVQSKAFSKHLRAQSNNSQLCEGAGVGGGEAHAAGWRVGWAEVRLGGAQPRAHEGGRRAEQGQRFVRARWAVDEPPRRWAWKFPLPSGPFLDPSRDL